ncbi:hypothetical protein ACFSYG_13725 [Leeuwenhoekiella polynyae]|uniref:Uncharacterized protein n=1 Tax=Leeuwenhoekiella polynyae TaxID=1550906 RepID=A0A4Q0P3Y9_9FLAO|nr:hypothetical protein [Leeuwenhoekiella polynyae]RXG21270.1 hypothetical protein DSM02_2123 [Leeuwenhoekiella polynyae]
MEEIKPKWYNRYIVGYLLILVPPLGLYGVYKSDVIPTKWKYVTYGALALAILGGVLIHTS